MQAEQCRHAIADNTDKGKCLHCGLLVERFNGIRLDDSVPDDGFRFDISVIPQYQIQPTGVWRG